MALGAGREAPGTGEHNGAGQGVFAPNVSKWARPRGLWTRLFRGTRREEEISFLTALRSIVPMGMYVSFCLYPHQLEVYRWMLRLVTF